jgi:hypothetical protein
VAPHLVAHKLVDFLVDLLEVVEELAKQVVVDMLGLRTL